MDQIDLLQEQVKMLAGEVALSTSSLKRLLEQAANSPDDSQIQVNISIILSELAGHIYVISSLAQLFI